MPTRVRWLIAGACVVTLLLVHEGLKSIYDIAGFASGMTELWFCEALPLLLGVVLALVIAAPSSVPRWLHVAVVLPLLHVVAIIVVALLWLRLDHNMRAHDLWAFGFERPVLPPLTAVIATAAMPIGIGLLVQHKRGEWAHASVMFALSFLLLVGLWLPLVCWDWIDVKWQAVAEYVQYGDYYYRWQIFHHEVEPAKLLAIVLLPPVILATTYTWLTFHRRATIARYRRSIRTSIWVIAIAAMLATATMSDSNALVYLAYVYVLLIPVVLAAVSLVALTAITWLRSQFLYHRLYRLTHVMGTVLSDAGTVTITSWLRGPSVETEPFVVSTQHGEIPVTSAELLAPVGFTLPLEIGEEQRVLCSGARVTLAMERGSGDGHPFRANELGHVAMVAAPGAERYRIGDVALVVWRPAVAYLAILIAVAAPAVVMILS